MYRATEKKLAKNKAAKKTQNNKTKNNGNTSNNNDLDVSAFTNSEGATSLRQLANRAEQERKPRSSKEKRFDKKQQWKRAEQERVLMKSISEVESSGYIENNIDTTKLTQEEIVANVDVSSAKKAFDLKLTTLGPYQIDFSRNGRHLAIGGCKGHLAAFDWQSKELYFELELKQTIRDVKWLHDETMLAVAQKKYVYVYDNKGLELHCMKEYSHTNCLEFLPYHFLLAGVTDTGKLIYTDISTGQVVAKLKFETSSGARCDCMAQNRSNGIIALGEGNGVVSMWAPAQPKTLVKMMCHRGSIRDVVIDRTGQLMATAGDNTVKIWDIRSFKGPLATIKGIWPASLDISDRRMLAVSDNKVVKMWDLNTCTSGVKNNNESSTNDNAQPKLYLQHLALDDVVDLHFVPYEDVLGIGHAQGFSSILVPGSGDPNFDTFEENPFQTAKQRDEQFIHKLLDKLPPETIALDVNSFAGVNAAPLPRKDPKKQKKDAFTKPKVKPVVKQDEFTVGFGGSVGAGGAYQSQQKKRAKKQNKQDQEIEKRTQLHALNQERKKRLREAKEKFMKPSDKRSALDRFKKFKGYNQTRD
eukprot:GEZU01016187.1.p1 GENE.GEZU01016187.1~~GEZU01016187.1.p1  ORF type:complete len:599 (-),score=183.77 GEZU01016187.1:230-1984(-)